jgi:hypothetical protein
VPAIATRSLTTVTWFAEAARPGAIRKSTVIVSASSNRSKPVAYCAVPRVPESAPAVSEVVIAAVAEAE